MRNASARESRSAAVWLNTPWDPVIRLRSLPSSCVSAE